MSERFATWNERVRAMRERRLQRLLSLLPSAYAAGAADSAIGELLDAFAVALAELDEAAERILRNRWLALAGGEPPWDEGPHPLEHLAALVGITPEPWEDDEPERFRRRVMRSVPALLQGPASVESILVLAAAALDTELCRRIVRDGDTTLAWGMRTGTVSACAGCRLPGDGPCQYEDGHSNTGPIRARLRLTDNPITACALRLPGLRDDQSFVVNNASLAPDRPTLTMWANDKPVFYPALQSFRTGEIVLYASELKPGDRLVIRPERTPELTAPFTTAEPIGPMLERAHYPEGQALLYRGDVVQNVTSNVLYLRSDVFGKGRFAKQDESVGAHFAEFREACRTPLVEHGKASWLYRSYTREEIEALVGSNGESIKVAPASTEDGGLIDLELSWWTRPPATFRLRVPFMPDIQTDLERCEVVLSLLRKTLAGARAAGVRALVDVVPELSLTEEHGHSASLVSIKAKMEELEERVELAEGPLDTTHSSAVDMREERVELVEGRLNITLLLAGEVTEERVELAEGPLDISAGDVTEERVELAEGPLNITLLVAGDVSEERVELVEGPLDITASSTVDLTEEHTIEEHFTLRSVLNANGFDGVFDMTRFDKARFGA